MARFYVRTPKILTVCIVAIVIIGIRQVLVISKGYEQREDLGILKVAYPARSGNIIDDKTTFVQINRTQNIHHHHVPQVSKVPEVSDFTQKAVHAHDFFPRELNVNRIDSFDYKKKMAELNAANVHQDNPELIDIIRNYYINMPSRLPYNLTFPNRLEFSNGQTPFVDSRLNYKEGGFYIECGALNGEKGSNTLFFEKVRKWNGILIEADPSNYAVLKTKHRKAFSMNNCLSPTTHPAKITFNKAFNMGRLMHDSISKQWMSRNRIKSDPVDIQCFPIYSILMALNQTTVDFFSLDIEGDELNILRTIPFDKLDIKMLAVEIAHGQSGLQQFMQSKGYETLLRVSRDDGGVNDLIFRKKGLTH